MALTAPALPRTPAPGRPTPAWRVRRYRILADVMMARGDWERAAAYEEVTFLCEHQASLDWEALHRQVLAAT